MRRLSPPLQLVGSSPVSRARVSSSAASSLTRIEPRAQTTTARASLLLREALPTRTPSPSFPQRSVTAAARSAAWARDLSPRAAARRAKLGIPAQTCRAAIRAHGLGTAMLRRYGLPLSNISGAVKYLEQGGAGCPRRTLRSPGAERSRQPYAAKPRGRGQADVEDTQRRPRAKTWETRAPRCQGGSVAAE